MLRIAADSGALARQAAREFDRIVTDAVRAAGVCDVALAGGSTPRSLYALLADPAEPFYESVPWNRVRFFWGDERQVPPDDPDSNYRMAYETLLSRVPVPRDNVYRVHGENDDAGAAAAQYEARLRKSLGAPAPALPRFDLVLLGLGTDGHTASLFPGTPAVHETTRLVCAVHVEGLRSDRITLTPRLLNNAASVIFLVSGESKAEALRGALEGTDPPERLPARAIRPTRGRLFWLVDREAAHLLTRRGARPGV